MRQRSLRKTVKFEMATRFPTQYANLESEYLNSDSRFETFRQEIKSVSYSMYMIFIIMEMDKVKKTVNMEERFKT